MVLWRVLLSGIGGTNTRRRFCVWSGVTFYVTIPAYLISVIVVSSVETDFPECLFCFIASPKEAIDAFLLENEDCFKYKMGYLIPRFFKPINNSHSCTLRLFFFYLFLSHFLVFYQASLLILEAIPHSRRVISPPTTLGYLGTETKNYLAIFSISYP